LKKRFKDRDFIDFHELRDGIRHHFEEQKRWAEVFEKDVF